MGNNASLPINGRAVTEVVRSYAISTLSERLTEEDGLLAEMSKEDVAAFMDRIIPAPGPAESRSSDFMSDPNRVEVEQPTHEDGSLLDSVSNTDEAAMTKEMLDSGDIPTDTPEEDGSPAHNALPFAGFAKPRLNVNDPHEASQRPKHNPSLSTINYPPRDSKGKRRASLDLEDYTVDSTQAIEAGRGSQHRLGIVDPQAEEQSMGRDGLVKWLASGAFTETPANDEKTVMSDVLVHEQLEGNLVLVDAAATTGGISEYENVPSDKVLPVIFDHAMLLTPVDHEPAVGTGAHGTTCPHIVDHARSEGNDENLESGQRSQNQGSGPKIQSLGVSDFLFQNANQLRHVLRLHSSRISGETDGDILSLREDFCRTLLKYGDRNLQHHLSLLAGSFMVERATFQNNPDLMHEGALLLEQYSAFAAEKDVDAMTHLLLGLGYGKLYRATEDSNHIDKALRHRALGILSVEKAPLTHLTAVRFWLRDSAAAKISLNGFELLEMIIDSITQPVALKEKVAKRHELLRNVPWEVLGRNLLTLGPDRDLEKGLASLERLRGRMWNQVSGLRTPLDELCSRDPAIADRFSLLSQGLEVLGGRLFTSEDDHENADAQLVQKFFDKVRTTIPGLEPFLRQPSSTEWTAHRTGVDVTIIVNNAQCDALILFPGSKMPYRAPLPNFSFSKAEQLQSRLRSSLKEQELIRREGVEYPDEVESRAIRPTSKRSHSRVISSILRDLWLGIAKPVLVEILKLSRSETPEMRIWWCTTGPLMSLPLHAAGIYEGAHRESVFDYAITSYIPTISIWTNRVQRSEETPVQNTGVCMVSQPEAPGLPPIPGTREEVARVAAIVEEEPDIKAVRLEDGAATKAAVLSAMGNHSWIHLACHGCQDPKEPLKSGFALADGRLEASTIIKHNSKHAEFAFLSACQTSTGDVTLSEESVHLAAAMLVAGYRGIVGTLWSINDRHAPDVAEDFYRELLDRSGKVEGKKRLDGEQAAYALHYAVQRLRKRVGDSNYLVWAPYVHLGV